jgi:hypothetical protein
MGRGGGFHHGGGGGGGFHRQTNTVQSRPVIQHNNIQRNNNHVTVNNQHANVNVNRTNVTNVNINRGPSGPGYNPGMMMAGNMMLATDMMMMSAMTTMMIMSTIPRQWAGPGHTYNGSVRSGTIDRPIETKVTVILPDNFDVEKVMIVYDKKTQTYRVATPDDPSPCSAEEHKLKTLPSLVEITFIRGEDKRVIYAEQCCTRCGQHFFLTPTSFVPFPPPPEKPTPPPNQQPYPGQPYPQQQPYPGQPYPGQPYPDQQYGQQQQQQYPQQPYPGQPYPQQQPYPDQPYPQQQPYSQQPYPQQQQYPPTQVYVEPVKQQQPTVIVSQTGSPPPRQQPQEECQCVIL